MTIIKYILKATALLLLTLTSQSYAQKTNPKKLEGILSVAIEKAYGSSVRIWGFDTLKKVQTSAQFTGVVVSAQGHVLTAAHVNQPGNTYLVNFPNGKTAVATGLGEIELTENKTIPDAAMMKIVEKGNWPHAEMGWSSSLKPGEPCLSIAYPETVNQARPSIRFGRITDLKNKWGFIQSTCIMEPGDSGGPLFDHLGRVVALHSAIGISEDENYEIPVDIYRRYWTALNTPQIYGTFPSVQDSVGTDPLRSKIITVTDFRDPKFRFAASNPGPQQPCIRIKSMLNGKEQLINGTLFAVPAKIATGNAVNSLIISKSSMIGNDPTYLSQKNNTLPLKVIYRDQGNDLVVLQALAEIKGGIQLKQFVSDTISAQTLGRLLVSPQPNRNERISIIGSMYFKSLKRFSLGYLGAMATFKDNHITITTVQPTSPAGTSGIEAGDKVLSISGITIGKPEDYGTELMKYWPGDQITFKIKRSENLYSKDLTLGIFNPPLSTHPADQFSGGKSIRRDGFAQVFSHDAIIFPDECGGPVFDLNQHFHGINIARFSRTTTLVIPAAVILELIKNYQNNLDTR
ncbi:MAG TPA: trypsin-like peptidase domain-containing protein [Pedobacter sp.]|uniref:trypsin-like peptidase domain-containing protein n=1 Tax=Pedobacter sp. TaxID=1411316 RepID=UPI002C3107C8|nr:trypsin-like peptidase domain-containing protein [Pedobacter sp.]HMI03881.1 trypsin-like peptidase domain-containing protein [Pedobacter sp.]